MKKSLSFFVKLILLAILLIQMSATSFIYGDIVPTDWESAGRSHSTRVKYTLLNEEITKKIDSFEELKNPSLIEKELFKKDFKVLLIKCAELNDKASSELNVINKREADATKEWQKATEQYYKNNPAPPSGSHESDFYYRYSPRMPTFYGYIDELVETKDNVRFDEKRLKQYLTQLGVNDFNFIKKNNRLQNSLFNLSGFVILLLIIGFNLLRYIRSKKQSVQNIEEG